MPADESGQQPYITRHAAGRDANVLSVPLNEWVSLAVAFKPGLGSASDNLGSNLPPRENPYEDILTKAIAMQIEKLVEAVRAVRDGRQIQGPTDPLKTPSGALQELYTACRRLFNQQESLRLINNLTNPPGLVIRTLRVDPNDLEADRNRSSGASSQVGAAAFFEGRTPPSKSGSGVMQTDMDYQGT